MCICDIVIVPLSPLYINVYLWYCHIAANSSIYQCVFVILSYCRYFLYISMCICDIVILPLFPLYINVYLWYCHSAAVSSECNYPYESQSQSVSWMAVAVSSSWRHHLLPRQVLLDQWSAQHSNNSSSWSNCASIQSHWSSTEQYLWNTSKLILWCGNTFTASWPVLNTWNEMLLTHRLLSLVIIYGMFKNPLFFAII